MSTAIDPSAAEFGKYRLLRKLAQGGMAEIFLALQTGIQGFEKVVVVKRVLPDLSASDDFVNMFLDEARIAARLDHPNIVRIYDLGEIDGLYYIAMEYLAGEDLTSVLQQGKRKKTHMPIEIAVDAIIGAAEGLSFAHDLEDNDGNRVNLVHRDVSPSNILITYQGVVKVLDFGIARAETNVSKTGGGQLKGKIQYLSPEQCRGTKVDRRSDVFALGITLHELLTSRRLFQRETQLASMQAILSEPLSPPSVLRPEVPEELDAIVMRALQRNVEDRFQTAAELAAELSIFLMQRGHVRGGPRFVEFLTELFGEERKQAKIRVAKGLKLEELGGAPPSSQSGSGFPAVAGRPPSRPGGAGSGSGRFTPVRSDAMGALPPLTPRGTRIDRVGRPSEGRALAIVGVVAALVVLSGLGLVLRGKGAAAVAQQTQARPAPLQQRPQAQLPVPRPVPPPAEPAPAEPPAVGLQVGGLAFSGVPPGTRVTVDGNAVGNPAEKSFFSSGKHRVLVEARGFRPFETEVELQVGRVAVVEVKLEPRPVEPRGTLEINCQPWCQIFIDGRDTGKTSPARLTVAAGPHALLLSNAPAGLTKRLTVTVGENAVVKKVVPLDE